MGKNTSVSLGGHFEHFVEERISSGRYHNASEVIRAGLRLLEEEEQRVQLLRNAIQEGIDSGLSLNFDPEKHLAALKSKKKQMNGLYFSTKAVDDLSAIWNYTCERWSEKQGEHYQRMLINSCEQLLEKPDRGKKYPEIHQGLSAYRAEQHIIFYCQLAEQEVEVLRILHSRMDLKLRMGE